MNREKISTNGLEIVKKVAPENAEIKFESIYLNHKLKSKIRI